MKTTREIASIGLSGPNTVARKLQLAGGTLEEIEDQVSWEAEQYLPFPIEDSTVSFHVFGENEGGGVDILVAAAKNDVIQNFKALVEKTKLRAKIIDLNMIAATNVFEHVMKEKIDESTGGSWILLDLGAQKTQFVIYRNNAIAFAISTGRISPWIVYNCESGQHYLERMNGDQSAIIWNVVDPDFWSKKFHDYMADQEYAKEILKKAGW